MAKKKKVYGYFASHKGVLELTSPKTKNRYIFTDNEARPIENNRDYVYFSRRPDVLQEYDVNKRKVSGNFIGDTLRFPNGSYRGKSKKNVNIADYIRGIKAENSNSMVVEKKEGDVVFSEPIEKNIVPEQKIETKVKSSEDKKEEASKSDIDKKKIEDAITQKSKDLKEKIKNRIKEKKSG